MDSKVQCYTSVTKVSIVQLAREYWPSSTDAWQTDKRPLHKAVADHAGVGLAYDSKQVHTRLDCINAVRWDFYLNWIPHHSTKKPAVRFKILTQQLKKKWVNKKQVNIKFLENDILFFTNFNH